MPTLRSFSSSAAAMSMGSSLLDLLCLSSRFYFLKRIALVDDAQTVKGQKFVYRADTGTFRRHERSEPAGGDNLRAHADLVLNPAHDAIDKTDITIEYSCLYGMDRIAPDHFLGLDDLDARQLGSALEQSFQRNRQARRDGAADVLAFLGNEVDGRRRAEIDDDAGVMKFFVRGDAVDDPIRAHLLGIFVKDRHAGFDAGTDDQRIDLEELVTELLRRGQHRRHDARYRDGRNLPAAVSRVIDELGNDHAV